MLFMPELQGHWAFAPAVCPPSAEPQPSGSGIPTPTPTHKNTATPSDGETVVRALAIVSRISCRRAGGHLAVPTLTSRKGAKAHSWTG